MTLCIAALCDLKAREKTAIDDVVVGCFDWRIETGTSSAQTAFKFSKLNKRWAVMMAGPLAQARELSNMYKAFLNSEGDSITNVNVLEKLREPSIRFRQSLASAYTQSTVAMPYDAFLRDGKTQLPEDLFRQISYDIAQQKLEAELILIGLLGRHFRIFECFAGEVHEAEDFAVIGSGKTIAESALYQREQSDIRSLSLSIYAVFEAKRLGENAPGVGTKTTTVIIHRDSENNLDYELVTSAGKNFLEKQFERFGPRKVVDFEIPEGFTASNIGRPKELDASK